MVPFWVVVGGFAITYEAEVAPPPPPPPGVMVAASPWRPRQPSFEGTNATAQTRTAPAARTPGPAREMVRQPFFSKQCCRLPSSPTSRKCQDQPRCDAANTITSTGHWSCPRCLATAGPAPAHPLPSRFVAEPKHHQSRQALRLLQWNADGLATKQHELILRISDDSDLPHSGDETLA